MQRVIERVLHGGVFKYWLLTLACGHTCKDETTNGRYVERKKCKQCEGAKK